MPETEVQELVELAARSTDGLAASRKWVVSPSVCRRYLAAAASASKPGATAALPFLLRSARWRDEQAVDTMLEDRALVNFEHSLRETMLYEVWSDASGRPLMVERVGAWDLARLTRLVDESPEQVVRAHILVQEASFIACHGKRLAAKLGPVSRGPAPAPWALVLRQCRASSTCSSPASLPRPAQARSSTSCTHLVLRRNVRLTYVRPTPLLTSWQLESPGSRR